MFRYSSIRLRRFARRMISSDPSPERTARGIAAGFFAAAFPLPGLQIPLSLFVAWLARGNKIVAIFPQFISNAGTMLPLAYLQYLIGAKFWPNATMDTTTALASLQSVLDAWAWTTPIDSLSLIGNALGNLSRNVLGPLLLGVFITGLALAFLAYPISLIALTYFQNYRWRARMARNGVRHTPPLQLPPSVGAIEADPVSRYAVRQATLLRADGLKLLVDGRQAYPEMLNSIQSARQTVNLETYLLRDDQIGRRFAAALSAAAERGVRTRLLFDGVGAMGLPYEYIAGLLRTGVRVAVYRPLSKFWRIGLSSLHRRDHRKILLVDEQIGFTGSLNISDNCAPREEGGGEWRDTHLRLDGAVPVRQLGKLFEATWELADEYLAGSANQRPVVAPLVSNVILNPTPSPASDSTTPAYTSRGALIQILNNKEFLNRVRLRRAYIQAIRNASRYILIENAYFIPDRNIRRALYHAVKRGVVVAVVVTLHSDVQIAAMASRSLYSELLAEGVRLYEYPLSMLHSKAAVIDDVWAIIGSYNLDHRSLLHNLEVGVLALDRRFCEVLRDQILANIMKCHEVTRELHAMQTWNTILLHKLAYQLRYWL
ncbi:MAG: DUF2062 domain-containing protein [Planctomycetota bacterium]